MKAIRAWWRRKVEWHRFTHGKCTDCGKYKPLQGSAICGLCLAKFIGRGGNVL